MFHYGYGFTSDRSSYRELIPSRCNCYDQLQRAKHWLNLELILGTGSSELIKEISQNIRLLLFQKYELHAV